MRANINIYNGDCLTEHEQIKNGSVDLILTDLPYGTINGLGGDIEKYKRLSNSKWDIIIEPNKIYEIANRILRKNGKMILFSQQPFTTELIKNVISNIPFSYTLFWDKLHFANCLLVNKSPVNYMEEILVFSKNHDTCDLHPLRNYLKDCKNKSKMTNKQFNNLFSHFYNKKGNMNRSVLEHYWAAAQFIMPTEEIYKKILQPTGYFPIEYKELKEIDEQFKNEHQSIFNLWGGNKYKSNILKYKKDYEGLHPTQKPILLLEDLIKTFSNKDDLIVDLTMGSGSTGIACINTNRNFIGIELDKEYFKIAKKRLEVHKAHLQLY